MFFNYYCHFNILTQAVEWVRYSIFINFTSRATMSHSHVLLVTFPVQGHMNPAIQFAKRLVRLRVHVTLATSVYLHRRIFSKKSVNGFSVAAFSDGYDDGFNPNEMDPEHYLSELRRCGSESLTNLIVSNAKEGRPFTYLVYTLLLPWAAEVAHGFHIPTALLWIQPATVLDIYYYYFHNQGDYIKNKIKENDDPSCCLELPGLPSFTSRDLPSFVSDSNMYSYLTLKFQEQLQALDQETNPRVFVNTFEALEAEALRAVDRFNMIAIGPLVPSALSDGKDPSDTSFGADLFDSSNDYKEWLDSKSESSVIYVSFGSISVLSKKQKQEIGLALLDCGRPFLWVIREQDKKEEEKMSCAEELEEKGKIVKWCNQVEILSHSSVGCFVTHCGWNSSLESLVCGVPVVAFPQWTDQNTNAKLIEDVWKTGLRVEVDKEEGIVKSEEIRRCLEAVIGNQEIRSNSKKWKELARGATKEGGSSDKNLKAFVAEIGGDCC